MLYIKECVRINIIMMGCLVVYFEQQFSVFKQHYTYFYTLFHPTRISKKCKQCYSNNITKRTLRLSLSHTHKTKRNHRNQGLIAEMAMGGQIKSSLPLFTKALHSDSLSTHRSALALTESQVLSSSLNQNALILLICFGFDLVTRLFCFKKIGGKL